MAAAIVGTILAGTSATSTLNAPRAEADVPDELTYIGIIVGLANGEYTAYDAYSRAYPFLLERGLIPFVAPTAATTAETELANGGTGAGSRILDRGGLDGERLPQRSELILRLGEL